MKKTLLALALIASSVGIVRADEYTFVFDGNNDMGGLVRQTTNVQANLTFSDSFEMTEEDIELSVKKIDGEGPGLALINAGGTNAGLCVFSTYTKSVTPEITLSVPGGKITGVKLSMSGSALATLELPFNDKTLESVNENGIFTWTWKGAGVETVTCSWLNSFYQRYIHSIKVEYTPDLGGKESCGLAFEENEYEAVLGESFTSPVLVNPNGLDVVWTSSNEEVANVGEDGVVTLTGIGSATIIAATQGNDQYKGGNARYVLKVIGLASDISELLEFAPAVYDRVKVNFSMVVNFANLSMAYVTDSENNAACVNDISNAGSTSVSMETMYKVGQVIPAGWIATNATLNQSVIWEGMPQKPTETVKVDYARVESVTKEDAERVVILENVTFTTRTAEGTSVAYGTTPDGTTYQFQDTFGVDSKPAGTYDVTCVVKYSKRGSTEYFFLAPIAYSEVQGGTVGVQAITTEDKSEYFDLRGHRVDSPREGVFLKMDSDGKVSKVIVK